MAQNEAVNPLVVLTASVEKSPPPKASHFLNPGGWLGYWKPLQWGDSEPLPFEVPREDSAFVIINSALVTAAGIVAGFVLCISPGMLSTWGGSAKGQRFFSLFPFDLGFFLFVTLVVHRKTSHPDHSSIEYLDLAPRFE
jgi:hypothetical protein